MAYLVLYHGAVERPQSHVLWGQTDTRVGLSTLHVAPSTHLQVISNHTHHSDWMQLFNLSYRCGMLFNIKMVIKAVLFYVPVVGFALAGMDFVFLNRSWQNDKARVLKAYQILKEREDPFWLLSHPEGTRFAPKKLEDAVQYAREQQLGYEPENTLIPRVKGFATSLQALRSKLKHIVDVTICYDHDMGNYFQINAGWDSNPAGVHLLVDTIPIEDVPEAEEDVKLWLYKRWQKKDEAVAHFKKHGRFAQSELKDIRGPPTAFEIFRDAAIWYCIDTPAIAIGGLCLYYLYTAQLL